MKLKKIAMMCIILVVMMFFSGCSVVGVDPQTLMSPPRPTGEKEKIHEVLDEEAGGDYTLKYPRRGQYRSAIIIDESNRSSLLEAVVLYQSNSTENAGITIMFVGREGAEWKNIGSFTNPATQVDQVQFGDVDKDGSLDVVVGWGGSTNTSNEICVYSLRGNVVEELRTERSYSEMIVTDLDADGYEEIFTASVTTPDQPASANLYRVRGSAIETVGVADLDVEVTSYLSVSAGMINEDQYGILLDGVKSAGTISAYVTELVYWDSAQQRLAVPFYDPGTGTANYMRRYISVTSQDINGDKVIEIPVLTLLPGNTNPTAEETCYLTNWYRYLNQDDTLERVMGVVTNSREGYWFMVPDMWRDQVTVRVDYPSRTMAFYEWLPSGDGTQNGAIGAALLRIQVFTEEEWKNRSATGTEGFTELARNDNSIYAASLPQPDHALSLRMEDVIESFELTGR